MKNSILLWLRIIRPQTLFASICPVVIGLLCISQTNIPIHQPVAIATIICAIALQVLSNLINDLYDFQRGTDQQGRQGFKRALAEGEVSEQQMQRACYIALGIALLTGAYLVYIGGWVILLIGLTAILFAWLYTATNHSLSYLGIADIFVFLYYGVIATMGTIYLQQPTWQTETFDLLHQGWWAGCVCGFCSMCVLMINNLRDMESDRKAGKRTFPVRFGKRAGEIAMAGVILLAPIAAGLAFRHWIPCLIIVPLIGLWVLTIQSKGKAYNRCLMLAGLCNTIYVLLVLAGI